jgi:hypothetical protein
MTAITRPLAQIMINDTKKFELNTGLCLTDVRSINNYRISISKTIYNAYY